MARERSHRPLQPPPQVTSGDVRCARWGSARSVYRRVSKAEVAGGHSVNANNVTNRAPREHLGSLLPPEPALTKPCRRQRTLSREVSRAIRAPVEGPHPRPTSGKLRSPQGALATPSPTTGTRRKPPPRRVRPSCSAPALLGPLDQRCCVYASVGPLLRLKVRTGRLLELFAKLLRV
jgi:hypothetical protein